MTNVYRRALTLCPLAWSLLVPFVDACSSSSGSVSGAPALSNGGAAGTPGSGSTTNGATSNGGATSPQNSGGSTGFFALPEAGLGAPNSCAKGAYASQLLPSNLLFLVDRSGSMKCNLPPTTDSATCEANPVAVDANAPTKWGVVTGAISSALDGLSQLSNTSAALTFFSNDGVCGVQSAPNVPLSLLSTTQIGALKGVLQTETPNGGTPLVGSIILGYKYLHQEAQAVGNDFVILVTDGSDSCLDRYADEGVQGDVVSRLLGTEIPKAISVDIRTFVIGAPGSESDRGLLSKIAFEGGTAQSTDCDHTSDSPAPGKACHFDMTATTDFAKDLSSALASITGHSAATCIFDVPVASDGNEVDTSTVNVDYYKAGDTTNPANKVALARDDTKPCDGGANGWQYIDGNTKIQLCGQVCTDVRDDSAAKVVVSVGCVQRMIN